MWPVMGERCKSETGAPHAKSAKCRGIRTPSDKKAPIQRADRPRGESGWAGLEPCLPCPSCSVPARTHRRQRKESATYPTSLHPFFYLVRPWTVTWGEQTRSSRRPKGRAELNKVTSGKRKAGQKRSSVREDLVGTGGWRKILAEGHLI